MKVCSKCKVEKEFEFYPKIGNQCNSCLKECRRKYREENKEKLKSKSIEYYKNNKDKQLLNSKIYHDNNKEHYVKYREINKEKISNYHKEWREENIEKLKEYGKEWREENKDLVLLYKNEYYEENKDYILNKSKKYYYENKEIINILRIDYQKKYRLINKKTVNIKRNIYFKNRCLNDSLFYLTTRIRNSIRASLKNKGYSKKSKTQEILGCSFEEFKNYIESKFEPWMTWENKGLYNGELNYGWDIDHIIPLSSVETEDDIVKLNHYTNLQPLCGYINRYIKGDKI